MPNGIGYRETNGVQYEWPYAYIQPKVAPHLGHSKHLCNLAENGADVQTVKNLVKDAKFLCKKCGRAAAKEENLCEPIKL